jgi:hypothetical protein
MNEWTIPKGTIVHLNGIPYELKADAVFLGANDPSKVESPWGSGRYRGETAASSSNREPIRSILDSTIRMQSGAPDW